MGDLVGSPFKRYNQRDRIRKVTYFCTPGQLFCYPGSSLGSRRRLQEIYGHQKLELIDGILVASELHVTKKKGQNTVHKTILNLSNVKFNQDLEFNMFTVRRMEKGL